jgi:hypothetical protein
MGFKTQGKQLPPTNYLARSAVISACGSTGNMSCNATTLYGTTTAATSPLTLNITINSMTADSHIDYTVTSTNIISSNIWNGENMYNLPSSCYNSVTLPPVYLVVLDANNNPVSYPQFGLPSPFTIPQGVGTGLGYSTTAPITTKLNQLPSGSYTVSLSNGNNTNSACPTVILNQTYTLTI